MALEWGAIVTYRYQHTQVAWVVLAAIGLCVAVIVVAGTITAIEDFELAAVLAQAAVAVVLMVCLGLFCSLTVRVGEDVVEIRFGPGLVRKRFPIRDIESCRMVKTSRYDGWGIHHTKGGWLFNVSGFGAVEITMRNGKKYRIGSDEPEKLEEAIRRYTR